MYLVTKVIGGVFVSDVNSGLANSGEVSIEDDKNSAIANAKKTSLLTYVGNLSGDKLRKGLVKPQFQHPLDA